MLFKGILSIYFDKENIKLVYAERFFITLKIIDAYQTKNEFRDLSSSSFKNKILNIIQEYIKTKNINPKLSRYVISKEDLIIRETVIPMMNHEYIKKNIFLEMENYLGNNADKYFIYFKYKDMYNKVINKTCSIRIFAVLKSQILLCKSISDELKLKVDIIEPSIESNERTLKYLKSNYNGIVYLIKCFFIKINKQINIDNYINNIGVLFRRWFDYGSKFFRWHYIWH